MDEHDDNLPRPYRHAAREEPPVQVDLTVMAQARRAQRQRGWFPFGGKWLAAGSVAVLGVVLVILMQGQPDLPGSPDATLPPEQAPVTEDGRIRLALPPAGARREAEATAADTAAVAAKHTPAEADAAAAASAAGAAGPPPPRFDFYRTLPDMQIEAPPAVGEQGPATPAASTAVVPAEPARPASAPVAGSGAAVKEGATAAVLSGGRGPAVTAAPPGPAAGDTAGFYLQVGSFRSVDSADRFRARLAGLQLPAGVEAIALANGEVWHRVRVGPYPDADAAETVQARLGAEGIDSLLLRPAE
jgi:cell division protein FtsN